MQTLSDIAGLPAVIQLAAGPVFLIFGVSPILSVLVKRLGRIADRLCTLEGSPATHEVAQTCDQGEMAILVQRARIIHWAIGFCAAGALLIGVLIGALIVSSITELKIPGAIAALIVMAMALTCAGLICFLRDIALAIGCIHSCHAATGRRSRANTDDGHTPVIRDKKTALGRFDYL